MDSRKSKAIFILVLIVLSALAILFFWKQIFAFLIDLFLSVLLFLVLAGFVIGWLNSPDSDFGSEYTIKKTGKNKFEIHGPDDKSD